MFRRTPDKDNSLFDNNDVTGETETSVEVTSAPVTAPVTSTGAAAMSAAAHVSSTPNTSSMQPSSPLSRPMSEPRSSTAPTAGAFRPTGSAMNSERNRMPEAKPMGSATGVGVDKANKSGRRVLTVGNDILLKGEIATCDRLVIEGKVDATLNDVHTVEIAETGSFKGSANIEDAEISGLFEGDLVVRNRLVIYATGKVYGKISYGEIEIERGGEISGEIKTTNPSSTSSSRPARSGAKADDKVAA